MENRKRILVADDEAHTALALRGGLSKQGYDIRVAGEAESALEIFNAWSPDLVISDFSVPHMTDLELCRRLRETSGIPIIILSVKEDQRVKIKALDAGADHYVTKPFGLGELTARVRALLRRSAPYVAPAKSVIADGDFRIDLDERKVSVRDKDIRLTPKEFELLVYLLQHSGKVLTHRTLLGKIWGGDYIGQPEYLRVLIGKLRKKIEADPARPRYILTEPWIGYRFEPAG